MTQPKFILSTRKVLEQYNKATQFADIVSYSSKTNPDVTPILENNSNARFNLHVPTELKRVKDLSRVYFIVQGWDKNEIKQLMGKGLFRFIVDNKVDLDILLGFLDENDVKIELLLRTKLKERTLRTERYFVYGMPTAVVNKRVKELHHHPKISKLGVHFHRKTQNMAEWNLVYEISEMFDEETLDKIDIVNVGGGLPSTYANTNVKVFDTIYNKLRELKAWLNAKDILLMIEPGRFICAPAVKLVTEIKAIYENNIILNASVYAGDTDTFVVPAKLLVDGELRKDNPEGKAYIIKGATPCSMDIFRYRVYLKNPQVGDKLIFLNAGAYNFATDFCDLDKIKTEVEK